MTVDANSASLLRPIIGIENRTAQEVFDIMCDRLRRSPSLSGGEVNALRDIAAATDPDDPESYRNDDREGCLDTVHAIASEALSTLNGAKP